MGLIYGVSTIADGNMSLKWGEEGAVRENRGKFLAKLGLKIEDCVFTSLNHGDDVVEVGVKDLGKTFECDAIVTGDPGVVLFMLTADCFPVVVYDDKKISLVHLGYQGVWKKLVQKVAGKFGKGARAIIGPGIRKESYFFDNPEQMNDPEWQQFLDKTEKGVAIDLAGYIKYQLEEAGIKNIDDCGVDTAKDKNYFSHYRSVRTGEPEGRFASVIMIESKHD